MDSALPVIEVVTFRANQRCMEDLELFKEVRDIVAVSTSVKAMYWGRSIELPSVFFWVLLWDSHAQSTAREETVPHAEMVRKLDALVDDPSRKSIFHTCFAEQDLPLACIEAPITEFDIAILKDMESLPVRERLAESIMSHLRATHLEGLLSIARGIALEDVLTNLYLAGWNSIEDHMKLGTHESHEIIVNELEEIFPYFRDLQIHHVRFERHA